MKIDVHAHYIPRDCFGVVDTNGQEAGPVLTTDSSGQESVSMGGVNLGPIARLMYDPETRIKEMDKIGLDMHALSVSPLSFFYTLDVEQGVSLSKRQNDSLAEWVKAYPDRFVGMATVPMQDAGKAAAELERAVTQLGFKAVEINTNINGKNLDEPEFLPFFEKAQALDVPVFLHPHYVIGAADRLSRHYLINLIGNPTDTTIAVASLILGGVMERFPRLTLVCAHAGGTTPFIKGRWDHAYHNLFGTKIDIPHPPSEYVKRLYFDTITHYKPALMYMIEDHGIDHIVVGSDYPFDMSDLDPVSTVKDLGLPAGDEEKVMWENAASILKL